MIWMATCICKVETKVLPSSLALPHAWQPSLLPVQLNLCLVKFLQEAPALGAHGPLCRGLVPGEWLGEGQVPLGFKENRRVKGRVLNKREMGRYMLESHQIPKRRSYCFPCGFRKIA